jgi:uncharacterized protein (TIGR00304 family)
VRHLLLIFCLFCFGLLCLLKTLFHLNLERSEKVDLEILYPLGIALIVVGVIVIAAVIIFAFIRGGKKGGSVRGAGVVMVGPIPIIFGTDKKAVKSVLALAVTLTIITIIIFLLNYWFWR